MTLALVHSHKPFEPRKWQPLAKAAFHAYRGKKGALISVATGGGKTALGHYLAADYLDRGERVLWLADQRTLVDQPYKTLARWWPHHAPNAGLAMANDRRNNPRAQIVYASKDTLKSERRMAELLEAGPFSLIVADEAHKSLSKTWGKVLDAALAQGGRLLGLTATPHREDGKNMSDRWDMVFSYSILDVIRDGDLVPPFAAVDRVKDLDLSDVKVSADGDYNEGELERALLAAHIVEHTVDAMGRMHQAEELPFRERSKLLTMQGRQVLVHTVTKEQARLTADALNAAGWVARYVSGDTSQADKDRLFSLFEARKVQVLVAAQLLSVGVDLPVADAEVFAAPTRSWVLFVQRLGRGLRASPGKTECFVLDLVGCTKDHSIVSAPVLVDGTDCEHSADGRHRYLAIEGSNEGRCQDCGRLVKCYALGGSHEYKDGSCKACGATQCESSPDKLHQFVGWEDHKRKCVHCAMEIPDPMAALVNRAPQPKEPVNWQRLDCPGEVYGVALNKLGSMFTVKKGDGFRAFLYARDSLLPLCPSEVDASMVRLLTDDVARRAVKVKGMFGGQERAAAAIAHAKLEALAHRLKVWEVR